MTQPAQSFDNHAKMVPLYHYWTGLMVLVPTVYFGIAVFRDFSMSAVMMFVFGLGVVLTTFWARAFPLGVQDRVIRLEEHLRIERLGSDEVKARVGELTMGQLIGLRFASDDELPELASRVLTEGITDRKEIKKAVADWRADHARI